MTSSCEGGGLDDRSAPRAASAAPFVRSRYAGLRTRARRLSRRDWSGGVSIASLLLRAGAAGTFPARLRSATQHQDADPTSATCQARPFETLRAVTSLANLQALDLVVWGHRRTIRNDRLATSRCRAKIKTLIRPKGVAPARTSSRRGTQARAGAASQRHHCQKAVGRKDCWAGSDTCIQQYDGCSRLTEVHGAEGAGARRRRAPRIAAEHAVKLVRE
jgi:hypothetical protein